MACEAFFDDYSTYVDATVDDEKRTAVIGLSKSTKLLYVVHVERDEDQIRIALARLATKQGSKIYEDS